MSSAALSRRDRIGADEVAGRVARFPVLAELLSERLAGLDGHRSVAVDKAPRLLSLLAQDGPQTEALLFALEATVREFDALDRPGWYGVRRRLAAERRAQFMPVLSEIVVARWARAVGFTIERFEPVVCGGRRADLMLNVGGEQLPVEIATPTAAQDDWTERANPRLRAALERVSSGLAVQVEGYDALRFEVDGPWGEPNDVIGDGDVDALVFEFARAAAKLGRARIPAEVVSPRDGQPVRITAVARQRRADRTCVMMSWSRSGLVPPVDRLCAIIEHEKKQLPGDTPSAVLVDLSSWSDFREEDYYLDEVAKKIRGRNPRTFVGSFDWRVPDMLPVDRRALADGDVALVGSFDALSSAWK